MEFVHDNEQLAGLLRDHGIAREEVGDRVYLRMKEGDDIVRVHITAGESAAEPEDGAQVRTMEAAQLPEIIDGLIHKLHMSEVLLVPVGKWRSVFDAVAFSLAENEDWQEMDAAATVELNTRDPLLCEPGDYHTVSALLHALLSDADQPEQGLMLTTTAAPVLVEVIPDGAVRMSFGNRVLADEAFEAIGTA